MILSVMIKGVFNEIKDCIDGISTENIWHDFGS